jgi:hypothetical protein
LAIDVPSFLSLAAGPQDTQPLPQGADLRFDLLPMTIDGVTSNLFYWDGQGSTPEDVQFGPVPQTGITLTLFDPNFVPTAADGTSAMLPGQRIGTTTTSADNLRLHAHRFFLLDDGDENEFTSPPDGIYLMALQLRMEGLRAADPIYVTSAGFQTLTPTVIDALDSASLPWVTERVDTLILDGDYDFNGTVNGNDMLHWQRHHGSVGPFPVDGVYPDGDGDGLVSGPDVQVWAANLGRTWDAPPATASPIPEPCTVNILLAAIIALACLRAAVRSSV